MAQTKRKRSQNIARTTKGRSANYRPTKEGAGMTKKGAAAYRKANPGSKLQTAVTEKNAKGKRAARRKSYCARSLGQLKKSNFDAKWFDRPVCRRNEQRVSSGYPHSNSRSQEG